MEIDELQIKYQQRTGIILAIFFVVTIVIAIQLYILLKNKRKAHRMLENVFSVIAHDLRSPISTLSSMSDLLLGEAKTMDDKEKNTIINHMDGMTKSLMGLLDNLLNWSKTQKDLIDYNPEVLKIEDSLFECLQLIEVIAKNKNVKIENEIPNDLLVYADKNALMVLLRNLLTNAIKFSYQGGKVRIFAHQINDIIQVGIEDNGVGMNSNTLKQIFSNATTDSNDGTNNESGTGMGLKICKEFIAINKGKIWAESLENKQTIFYFSLPKYSDN